MRKVTKVPSLIAVVSLAITLVLAANAAANATGPVPPGKNVYGMSYGDWSAAWWQYVLQIPAASNPATDSTGALCGVDQATGPVFFLVGNFTSATSLTRSCKVPAGKTLVIPVLNVECSTLEAEPYFGGNEKELRACAGKHTDLVDVASLKLTIDKRKVPNLAAYRVQSPVFQFHLPPANVLGLPNETETTGLAVSDGYWVILEPLPPGNHTIHFEGTSGALPSGTFSLDITYEIEVQPLAQAGLPRPKVARRAPR